MTDAARWAAQIALSARDASGRVARSVSAYAKFRAGWIDLSPRSGLWITGSLARSELRDGSDVDLLVVGERREMPQLVQAAVAIERDVIELQGLRASHVWWRLEERFPDAIAGALHSAQPLLVGAEAEQARRGALALVDRAAWLRSWAPRVESRRGPARALAIADGLALLGAEIPRGRRSLLFAAAVTPESGWPGGAAEDVMRVCGEMETAWRAACPRH